ncbi:MAG TPA: GspH/FimT family pseudopilin [Casimicrobiaceae bacterium]|nr:GspH/FimT family pseudopilin [Casimicrobiaceae bacterium]
MSQPNRRNRAFTLIELCVALAIAAVLFAVALPSFARYVTEQKLLAEARRLSEAIAVARSEAIKRNTHVVVCAKTPTQDCGTATHWHEGWVVFEDHDGNAEVDAGDVLFAHDNAAANGVTITGNRPVARYLRFDFMGQARMINGALQMGTITVCRSGLVGYEVVVANAGRTRIDRTPGPCP